MTTATKPKQGKTYRSKECGMELKITVDCDCKNGCPVLACCGEPLKMKKA